MARFATILIDLDGTLVDAFTTIHRAYVHTLPQFGRPAPTMEQVRRAVGGGLENAMGHFLPPDLIAEAMKVHVAYTQQILLEDVTLMPGGMELLRSLHARGVKLGVLTNKQAEASRRICAHLGVTPLLGGIFGAGDTPWLKPQVEFTAHALQALGAEATSAMLIGDSPFDVKTARNAGFPCWAVTTGTHDEPQLRAAGADEVFPSLAALGAQIR
ncbi:MAG TPA: HAD family hydrolase [Opitutaceae bacterium]|nr:HAD family hydrolase [Opitutaceae bacterium]HND61109.1 HAD family hydrolase [Opitutaceae bacterium]